MGKKKIIEKTDQAAQGEKSPAAASVKTAPAAGGSKKIESGKIFINASYNNTFITVTDKNGNAVAWVSAGSLGFSGPKKATPFAAAKAAEAIAEKIQKTGPFNVDVIVKGVGTGRDSAIRSLINKGFNIGSIKDLTPVPHNGPRPPKRRRV